MLNNSFAALAELFAYADGYTVIKYQSNIDKQFYIICERYGDSTEEGAVKICGDVMKTLQLYPRADK